MTGSYKKLLVAASLILLAGCGRLPDVNKIQSNMDQMVYYMGVMASGMPTMVHSTARMANTAERMQAKTDALLADLQGKGTSAERAIQNYSQAVLDNERGVIKNLQGIRQELGDLRQALRPSGPRTDTRDQPKANMALQAKLNELEDKLAVVMSRIEKMERKSQ